MVKILKTSHQQSFTWAQNMLLEQFLKQPKNSVICKFSSQHLTFITRELKLPSVCCSSTSATSPWGLGLHPLYELQAMANQPRFFPNLSQESSHLEQQQPLCAFHTGSEKENRHTSKEFCAEQLKNTEGSNEVQQLPAFIMIVFALHLHLSVVLLLPLQIHPAPLPRWAGHREI